MLSEGKTMLRVLLRFRQMNLWRGSLPEKHEQLKEIGESILSTRLWDSINAKLGSPLMHYLWATLQNEPLRGTDGVRHFLNDTIDSHLKEDV
jgi:hypothetical protein